MSSNQHSSRDYALERVPDSERQSAIGIAATTAGWIIAMSTLYTGGVLASAMGFMQALRVTIVGMAILACIGFLQGWIGARQGVSTSVLATQVFGTYGGKLFALLIAFLLGVGWAGWQLSFFGNTVAAYWSDSLWAQPKIAACWGAVLVILSVLYGYRALSALSLYAVPLIVVLSVGGIWMAVDRAGGWVVLLHASGGGQQTLSFVQAVGLVVGNGVIGAVLFPDLSRFARSPLRGATAAAGGFFAGGLFLIMAGAAISYAVGSASGDLPVAMRDLGVGFLGFLILLFAQWTTNNNNLYSGALAFTLLVGGHNRAVVIVMGLLGAVIAVIGVQDYFVPALTALGTFVPPVAGVMIADRLLMRGDGVDGQARTPAINFAAVAAVLIAGFVASQTKSVVPALTSVVLAAILYAAWSMARRRTPRHTQGHTPDALQSTRVDDVVVPGTRET